MSIYILTTLNRVAKLNKSEDNGGEVENNALFDNGWNLLDCYKEIEKKYQVKLEEIPVETEDYSGMVCVIHNAVDEISFGECLYEGAMLVLPEVKSDDMFLERSNGFLREASKINSEVSDLIFDEPKKRSFCSS